MTGDMECKSSEFLHIGKVCNILSLRKSEHYITWREGGGKLAVVLYVRQYLCLVFSIWFLVLEFISSLWLAHYVG